MSATNEVTEPEQETELEPCNRSKEQYSEAASKQRQAKNKADIARFAKLFENYKNDMPYAADDLYPAIFDFAVGKINSYVFDIAGESYETEEDHAQDVGVYIWEHLADYRGDANGFWSWMHTICKRKGKRVQGEVLEENKVKVPLFVESEDGSGIMEDNPILNRFDDYHERRRELPDFITQDKTSKLICSLIRADMNYSEIGEVLGITENAVKLRVKDMRNTINEMKKNGTYKR